MSKYHSDTFAKVNLHIFTCAVILHTMAQKRISTEKFAKHVYIEPKDLFLKVKTGYQQLWFRV